MEYLIQIGLDGLTNVLNNQKFTTSQSTENAIKEYEESNNPILMFFKEFEEDDPFVNQSVKSIYRKYAEYCLSNSMKAMSNIEFSKEVKRYLGYDIVRKSVDGKKVYIFVR